MLAVRTDSDDAGRMRALRLLWRYPVITLTVLVFAVVGALHAAGEETIGRWVATIFVAAVVVWTLIGMVRDVLNAYGSRDAALAQEVIRRDEKLDQFYNTLFRSLLTHMMENPATISSAAQLLFIARNLERIGDHATNVAEMV